MSKTAAPPSIAFALAELIGGPYHGQRFKVRTGPARLMLTTRPKRSEADKPPTLVYERTGDAGPLRYRETIGTQHRPATAK